MSSSTGSGDTDPTPPTQPQGKFVKMIQDNKQLGVGGLLLLALSTGMIVGSDDLRELERELHITNQQVAVLAANQKSLLADLDRASKDNAQSDVEFQRIKELVFRQLGKLEK